MNHVKGDMDDLFRRASEKYPLRTDSADWDRLAADLDSGSGMPSDIEAVEKRKRRGIFWWFLLLPLAGVGYLAWHASGHSNGSPSIPATAQTSAAGGGATVEASTAGKAGAGETAKESGGVSTGSGGISAGSGSVPAGSGGVAAGSDDRTSRSGGGTVQPAAGGAVQPTAGEGNDLVAATTRGNGQVETNKGKSNKSKLTGNGGRGRFDADNVGGTGDVSEMKKKTYLPVGKEQVAEDKGSVGGPGSTGSAERTLSLSALDLRTVPTAGRYNLVVDVNAPVTAPDNTHQSPKKTTAKPKPGHGYVGIIGAPDLSTVKFQSTKGVGTTLGVLLGYSFNDRWAIESGVYLDQKKYYSSGEYFNEKGVSVPYGTNLLNVNGTCHMWEIPLNVRYNFSKSERMKWFVTAGLSTYLMSREYYDYNSETSSGAVWGGSWDIKKPSQYWFSIVNISAGFEQRIGKIGNLRIEPYLRLPLSGIGTGRLPIMSAGLNIGITHQLW